MRVDVYCAFCSASETVEVPTPQGWARVDNLEEERGLCPTHAPINPFVAAQCPGCVGGWGDCPLWDSFASSGRRRDMGAADFAQIERGICPRRVNGTFGVNMGARSGTVEKIDLSEPAEAVAGKALAKAIREYIERYP